MKSNEGADKDIDEEIDKARKLFYSELMSKKRVIRRKFLQLGSLASDHHMHTLPHRALLNQSETFLDSLNTCTETEDSLGDSQTSSIETNFEHNDNYSQVNITCPSSSSISTEPSGWDEIEIDFLPTESDQTIQIQTTDDDPEIESLIANAVNGSTVVKDQHGASQSHAKS